MTIEMQRRMLYTPVFHIDTNLINARGKLDAMNKIERWAEEGLILVNMSGVSFKEAQAGGNSARTRKALSQIFTLTDENIDPSKPLYRKIEAALFPEGAKTNNERNDVKIVYEAAHYAAILVTRDGDSTGWDSWKPQQVEGCRADSFRFRGRGVHPNENC